MIDAKEMTMRTLDGEAVGDCAGCGTDVWWRGSLPCLLVYLDKHGETRPPGLTTDELWVGDTYYPVCGEECGVRVVQLLRSYNRNYWFFDRGRRQ